jgi:hypothetical protein
MRRESVFIALLLFAAFMSTSKSADCGPGDPGKIPALSLAQLRDVASKAGFTGQALDVAVAIALEESRGFPEASGDPNCGVSLGLWQINVRWHPEYRDNPDALFDPATNAAAAFKISQGGANWAPWSSFASGAYLAFMPGGKNYPKGQAA